MLDWISESVLVSAFLSRMKDLTDPDYKSKDPVAVAAETIQELVDKEAVIVHVDAGSRILQGQGSPVTLLKLAIYEIDFSKKPPDTNIYYPVYSWQQGSSTRKSYMLYAQGDYRVRQALSYIVEIAALYSRMKHYVKKGRLVIGFRDGPLIQLLGQYLSPVFSIDQKTLHYALRYAGLDVEDIYDIIFNSNINNNTNTGLVMLEIIRKLYDLIGNGGYPAGVVEDTSRSRALMLWLLADIVVDTLNTLKSGDLDVGGETVKLTRFIVNKVSEFVEQESNNIMNCMCTGEDLSWLAQGRRGGGRSNNTESHDEVLSWFILKTLPDIIYNYLSMVRNMLVLKGIVSGGYKSLQEDVKSGKEAEVYMSLVRAASLSQIFREASTRDPDIVMVAYYLGILESFVTRQVPRYSVLASIRDAVDRVKSSWRDDVEELYKKVEKYDNILKKFYMRYIITDPPLTCRRLKDELKARNISELRPCDVARLDTYLYAPPVRLEYFEGSDTRLVNGAVVLESLVARYRYPVGILIADKASRLTMEEALTARPLARRLIPLRYYIRSWEKRIEYT